MIRGWDHEESVALLHRARRGDDAAFSSLYRSVAPMARRTAHRIVRDTHAADDLVQETFYLVLKAVRAGGGPRDSFTGYVLSTVKRLAYRYSTAQSRTIAVNETAIWEEQLRQITTRPNDADGIEVAWANLPPRWRTVLWLIEVDRYSPAEVAAGMAMTPNAVSSLATRARQALRAAYLAMPHDQ